MDYHIGQLSIGSQISLIKPEFKQYCIIEYYEIGRGSGGGESYCYFKLDSNDFTKIMVFPQDI